MPDSLVVEEVSSGQVRVSLQRAGQKSSDAGEAVVFATPFDAAIREDLRWYLEDYLIAPFAVYEERGQQIRARLRHWGETLFDSIFGLGKPGRDAYLQAREGSPELALISRSANFLALPWELVKDPAREAPLALIMRAFDRTLHIAGASTPVPPGEVLRVLMVIARPAGGKDVGYQMVARPRLERLGAVRGKVVLDVLRLPTLPARARRCGLRLMPAHHTTSCTLTDPYLWCARRCSRSFATPTRCRHCRTRVSRRRETRWRAGPGGGGHFCPDDEPGRSDAGAECLPLGGLGPDRGGSGGGNSATGGRRRLGRGHGLFGLWVATAEFMAAFYEALFGGKAVYEAVAAGRHLLFQNKLRPSPKGELEREDWMVSVHYCAA